MKKLLSGLLGIAIVIAVSAGCMGNKQLPTGFTPEQITAIGQNMFGQLCSGDYVCVNAGTYFTVGTKSRIGGNWNAPPCPTFVTTTDNAKWQFVGKCTCP